MMNGLEAWLVQAIEVGKMFLGIVAIWSTVVAVDYAILKGVD